MKSKMLRVVGLLRAFYPAPYKKLNYKKNHKNYKITKITKKIIKNYKKVTNYKYQIYKKKEGIFFLGAVKV
jgi:hypothetical protein